jgi:hypothetical protein
MQYPIVFCRWSKRASESSAPRHFDYELSLMGSGSLTKDGWAGTNSKCNKNWFDD